MNYQKFIECDYHHPEANTLSELIEYTSKFSDNGITLHSLTGTASFLSYKSLFEKAKVFSGALKRENVKGAVLLCIDDSESFLVTLWGCILMGIPSAPLEPLRSNEISESNYTRLTNICLNHEECTVITDEANIEHYRKMIDSLADPKKKCLSVSALKDGNPIEPCKQNENDCIIIQYSSGSTGEPKGVKLSHKNIMYSLGGLVTGFKVTTESKVAIWTPHFHNMGLFINVVTMQVGCNIDIFHPASYVQDPTGFFKLVSEKKINIITSNNFGLEWAIKNTDIQSFNEESFSNLDVLVVGSEVISENTLNRFYDKFKKYGLKKSVFKPCYGLTEAVLAVAITGSDDSFTVVKNDGDEVGIVGNGKPLAGTEIRITDKDGNILGEDQYGEIIVKSKAVTSGYVGSDESCCNSDGWLKTGDIGFIHDGNLYISGRQKEMFIVRGHNYMIHDLEREIIAISGLPNDMTAICSNYDNDKKEEILILFIAMPKSEELLETLNNISDKMIAKYGFSAEYVVFLDDLCRTGSRKIDRMCLINKFKNKEYIECIKVVNKYQNTFSANKESSSEIEEITAHIWAEVLNLDISVIKNDVPFYEYGGNSVKQYQMMEMLNRKFDLHLQPSFFRQCNTIKEIAEGIFTQTSDENEIEENAVNLGDEIAVTGFSFRLPGAENNDELWEMLTSKKSVISKVSDERKNLTETPEWDNWIGELKNIDLFDAKFFDISDKEAEFMDPQQRLILETAYEALEDAAEAIIRENPKNIGVYAALDQQPYLMRVKKYYQKNGIEKIHESTLVSNLMNVAAARISHFFNFSGPAVALDSACSSFLNALHTARRAIQCGDISSAVVSTAHIIIEKEEFDLSERAGILSKSGRSKVFDKDADGSVLGEGVISVFIEPLKTAVNNKKHIYAVIKGSAVNNDGYSLSIMAPNSDGQYDVLKRAYRDAGISPDEISYLEAHGTGTKIGDPIELHALVKLFSEKKQNKQMDQTIGIGSIKSNIGHLLPAASGAGFVKLLICFEKKMLVPGANFETVNPALRINKTPFFVVKEPMEWKTENYRSRIAGITSLGLGGTNVHMILEEGKNKLPEASSNYYPLVVSAKSQEALEKKLSQLNLFMNDNPDSIGDICYTSCCGRMSYNYRAVCVIDKNNIGSSFKNAVFSVYDRIRSMPVYIVCSQLPENKEQFDSMKKYIDVLTALIKENKGFVINDMYISAEEWNEANLYEKLKSSKKTDNALSIPKKVIKLGIDSTDSDISCSLDSLKTREGIINTVNHLYLSGAEINWNSLHEFKNCGIVSLPRYPFNKKSYWI